MPILLELFLVFAKIGLFTFGGGYAMIALIENICVTRKGWITHEDMTNITVIAESSPGPIAINCATYVGYKMGGFVGSVCATFGVVVPSFTVIYIISKFLGSFLEITIIAKAFAGIKIAVGILILNAAFNLIKKMKKKPLSVAILVCACIIMLAINIFALNISTILLMLSAGIFSLVVYIIRDISAKRGGASE